MPVGAPEPLVQNLVGRFWNSAATVSLCKQVVGERGFPALGIFPRLLPQASCIVQREAGGKFHPEREERPDSPRLLKTVQTLPYRSLRFDHIRQMAE